MAKAAGQRPLLSVVLLFLLMALPIVYMHAEVKDGPSAADLEKNLVCAARCAAITPEDHKKVADWVIEVARTEGHTAPPDTSPEQICLTACAGVHTVMHEWLPGTFGAASKSVPPARLAAMREAYEAHLRCAHRCVGEGILVDVAAEGANAPAKALEVLERCGMVEFSNTWDPKLLDLVSGSVTKLRAQEGRYQSLYDERLHGNRYQVYLPFAPPFDKPEALGMHDVVHEVLTSYFAKGAQGASGWGIDHVSVISSRKGSGNQTLHPDVPYLTRLHLSVHTALTDITRDMGPTYLCPCSGKITDDWATNAGIRHTLLQRQKCLSKPYVRESMKRGEQRIYDGTNFHMGLDNWSPGDRHVFKLEVGAGDHVTHRDFAKGAQPEVKKQVELFRRAFPPPRFGAQA